MRTRTLILSIACAVGLVILFGVFIYSLDAKDFETPKTTYVCTSSSTFTPDGGEQKTEMICKEQ